jgi:hypothetical protein
MTDSALPPINTLAQPPTVSISIIDVDGGAVQREAPPLNDQLSSTRNAIEQSHQTLLPPIGKSQQNLTITSASQLAINGGGRSSRSNSRTTLNGAGEQALNDALNLDQNEVFITQRAGKLLNLDEYA